MIDINCYMEKLIELLKDRFESRLIYVGLQGSYLRGEATENSDIDVMVVINNLSVKDLEIYRSLIQSLGDFDKSCGFICSRDDLAHWNPLEICHLLHTTRDYVGKLSELVPTYTKDDIETFIQVSVNNLYHAICHHYVHAESNHDMDNLSSIYKGVFFILQNLYYLNNETFVATKNELLSLLKGKDHAVLKRSIELSQGISHDYSESFELLFSWCQETIKKA